jgi:hypothetical protein
MIVRKISEYFTNVGDMDTTTGSDIKIGDGSKKTFKTVMRMWCEDSSRHLKRGRSRMMKRAGNLKVGIHLKGGAVDIV